jgi:hypothetical protein
MISESQTFEASYATGFTRLLIESLYQPQGASPRLNLLCVFCSENRTLARSG